MSQSYAEIILPLPLNTTFTYAIPDAMVDQIGIGHRVIVPFGAKKYITGIVSSITTKAPVGFEVKEIAATMDSTPIVRHPQLKFWAWIADYYMCAEGDVYKAAVPAGLKVESETFVEANPDYEFDAAHPLTEAQTIINQLLCHDGAMSVAMLEKKSKLKRVEKLVADMIELGIIIVSEKIVERYRSQKIKMVRPLFDASSMAQAFAAVKGARKQEQLLMALIEQSAVNRKDAQIKEVTRANLLERSCVTAPILNAVVAKGIAEIYIKEVNRFKYDGAATTTLPTLTDLQRQAMRDIISQWSDKSTVLLHGVTSSGKTEIYAHIIEQFLQRGDQVLYLVPEIALTTQLTRRLQSIFGDRVVVYHSKFSDNERVDIWKMMLTDNTPRVILGARSSLFLPFARLGLVIVDEEHDSSYKQNEPAPRYNARDVAIVLASMHGAKTLLGSATPAIETYYKATHGKFGLVKLTKRFHDVELPPIEIVDMTEARKRQEITGTFSSKTISAIDNVTAAGEQAIVFRNRRGFAPLARCKQCAWIPRCRNCDVSLTYHQYSHQLVCHYCGASYQLPNLCPQCKQPAVEVVGYGTERIEEDVEKLFPERKILRMDLDTTRNKDSYETIINNFSNHKADILVGTQMVSKGLDFGKVTMVAVVNADELINIPDFKSTERSFNMLEQVAGRAGRSDGANAKVIIQTYQPAHPIFAYLKAHDYDGFYNHEIEERCQFNYPPFTHIIYVYLKHRDANTLSAFSQAYANSLRAMLGNRVSGPDKPKVARVKLLYIQKIMLKIESSASMSKVRAVLRDVYTRMAADPAMRTSTIYYDVDPQ
jgi:primosomal protein N' (replication factor Y)